jgi:biotin synthase
LRTLLSCPDDDVFQTLAAEARLACRRIFGRKIFVRGLLEISNHCRNDCYYCGIRNSNRSLRRYRLTTEEIVESCRQGHELGFRTFVLQGGEDPSFTAESVEAVVATLHRTFPDSAITLSLGEQPTEYYRRWRLAGADRYLLRHETWNAAHYRHLHPARMSRNHRLACLYALKALGYQTGCGMMVGSPGQTLQNLIEDLRYMQRFRPAMIGMGPFIPHHATPFAHEKAGSVTLTLKLLSIVRLLLPDVLLPATTALATIGNDGWRRGILAGANVVMLNLSPHAAKAQYQLYDNKIETDDDPAHELNALADSLKEIGYEIAIDRGDAPRWAPLKEPAEALA